MPRWLSLSLSLLFLFGASFRDKTFLNAASIATSGGRAAVVGGAAGSVTGSSTVVSCTQVEKRYREDLAPAGESPTACPTDGPYLGSSDVEARAVVNTHADGFVTTKHFSFVRACTSNHPHSEPPRCAAPRCTPRSSAATSALRSRRRSPLRRRDRPLPQLEQRTPRRQPRRPPRRPPRRRRWAAFRCLAARDTLARSCGVCPSR